jgi:hypothetical protein
MAREVLKHIHEGVGACDEPDLEFGHNRLKKIHNDKNMQIARLSKEAH